MSKFYSFANIEPEKRKEIFDTFMNEVNTLVEPFGNRPLLISADDFRSRYKNLLDFASALLARVQDSRRKLLAVLMLFYAEDSPNGELTPTIYKAANQLKAHLLSLPYSKEKIFAQLCDARLSHEYLESKVDLIVTSPPYINVFNYHQNYRAILEILGFDMLKVAQSELGSNRKNRGNRFKTVVQYCLDMEMAVSSLARCLKPNGCLVMVMGRESRVRRVAFSNSVMVKELLDSVGCFSHDGTFERVFLNRFGEQIYEDILVVRRNPTRTLPPLNNARNIAVKHLKSGLAQSSSETKQDISMAIEEAMLIRPSPLLKRKDIV